MYLLINTLTSNKSRYYHKCFRQIQHSHQCKVPKVADSTLTCKNFTHFSLLLLSVPEFIQKSHSLNDSVKKLIKKLYGSFLWMGWTVSRLRSHYEETVSLHNKYIAAHQYWWKVSKIFHIFRLHLRLPAIVNLIFHTVRLENFMTSYRDELYLYIISNKIKFNFLINLFGKMSSSKSLPSSGTESEIKKNDWLRKIRLGTRLSWSNKIKSSSCLLQGFCEWSV